MPGTLPPESPPGANLGDAPTVPRGRVGEDASIELSSAAFLDELGPPSQSSEERAASLVGTLISERYRVDEILGQGGMGAVFRGEQIHLRKRVAIKLLHPDTERLPGLVDRFEREAVAGAHVQHPNVAAATDFGKLDDGSYFLVLELVEGTPLSEVLAAGPLAPARALRIARQMAAGLAAVHDKGIVHRDVKPQNTLIGAGDHVKIIDFGLAKVDIGSATGQKPTRKDKALTAAGVVFGTPAYLAPEAALGMGAVDARSDLYALGVTLYEMLSGRQPFDGKDPGSLFRQQRLDDPPPFRVRAPGVSVPAAAERVAMRLVQRAPTDRYQSAEETIAAIDEALAALSPAAEGLGRGRVRPSRWVYVAVALGLLALGGVVMVAVRDPGDEGRRLSNGEPSAHDGGSAARAPVAAAPVATHGAASASASASAAGSAWETEEADAAAWRGRLDKASQIKDWVLGSKAFLALVRLEPTLLDDAETRTRVIAVAAGIAHEGRGELADAVFDALGAHLGTKGLDLLYDLALSRGGTRGGARARAVLERADVLEREPRALRVAFEFFVGSCPARRALIDRAVADGDRRVLVQMEAAHGARCANRKDPCCFREDPAMAEAIAKLKARVEPL
jgi:eukaryotic-like serine/threonine-protein kinase